MRLIVYGKSRSGTTILADIMRGLPNSWILHESRIYDRLTTQKKAKAYYNSVLGHMKSNGNVLEKMPPKFNKNTFVKDCMKITKSNKRKEWMENLEKIVFKGKYKIWGDKTGFTDDKLKRLLKLKVPTKYMFIYRDGRDVVASGVRHNKQKGTFRRTWAMKDSKKLSKFWARCLNQWEESKHLIEGDYIEVKFEELVNKPKKVAKNISSLIKIPEKRVLTEIKRKVNKGVSHIGYHKKWVPNWKKKFTEDALKMLEHLEYI